MQIAAKVFYGSWDFGGSLCYLVFKANQQFVASNGEIVQPGVYRREICTVVGRNRTSPIISNIPATTDSMPSDATWEIYFEDSKHTKRDTLIAGAKLPHTYTDPVNFEDLVEFNAPPGFTSEPPRAISYDQTALMIQRAIAAISPTVVASGLGTLSAALPVTILNSHVAADSPIRLLPKTENITGELRALNRVAGVSFDVVSDNGADSGNFRWEIYP